MSGAGLKTYSHLAAARRMPTEYEVTSSRLLYHVGRGLEVETPIAAWFARHQAGSALSAADWELFRDPRETTYTKYTALQRAQEAHADGVLRSIELGGYDAALSPAALDLLARTWPPARFLFHGLGMLAAYVGQVAPSGRITITCALQAADELRRIERVAQRLALIGDRLPGLAQGGRARWQEDAAWQPLRRVLEELLVTYDWGEAFAALALCLKPAVDELFMVELPGLARLAGDYLLGELCLSLDEDCQWHRLWSAALVDFAVDTRPANRAVLAAWVARWRPRVEEAVAALGAGLAEDGDAAAGRALARSRAWLADLGPVS